MQNKYAVIDRCGAVRVFNSDGTEVDVSGGYKIQLEGNSIPFIEVTYPVIIFTSVEEMKKATSV